MNRFARSSALVGAALVALVLAIAASATTTRSERSAAPTAGAAVTNYLTYVKGKRGKADPKKSKVLIGWVNQLRSQGKHGMHTPHEFVALDHPLHEMRLFKSRAEMQALFADLPEALASTIEIARRCASERLGGSDTNGSSKSQCG